MDPANDLLSQLEGLDLPQSTGIGLAPGWWILLLLVLLLLFVVWYRLKQRKKPATQTVLDWRPQASREIARIRDSLAHAPTERVLSDSSRLARRIALAVAPREEIAALHGQAWMLKLNELSDSEAFTKGPGQLLLSGPYEFKPGSENTEGQRAQLEALLLELDGLFQTVAGKAS